MPGKRDYLARIKALTRRSQRMSWLAHFGSALMLCFGLFVVLASCYLPFPSAAGYALIAASLGTVFMSVHQASLAWDMQRHIRHVMQDCGLLSLALMDDDNTRLTSLDDKTGSFRLASHQSNSAEVAALMHKLATRYEPACFDLGVDPYPKSAAPFYSLARWARQQTPLLLVIGTALISLLMVISSRLAILWFALLGMVFILAAIIISYFTARRLLVMQTIEEIIAGE